MSYDEDQDQDQDATAFQAYKEYTGLMLDSKRLKEELAEIKDRCEKLKKTIKGDNDAWVELNDELKDTREKLHSVTCHRNDLMDSVSNLQKEIRLLKTIMDMMKDKANE